MPRKERRAQLKELAQTPPRFPAAVVRRQDLIGRPVDVAPYIANEMRKHNATQDDINDFYTEVRRCKDLNEACAIIKKYVRLFER